MTDFRLPFARDEFPARKGETMELWIPTTHAWLKPLVELANRKNYDHGALTITFRDITQAYDLTSVHDMHISRADDIVIGSSWRMYPRWKP